MLENIEFYMTWTRTGCRQMLVYRQEKIQQAF
jgi:hypothetical protein